MVNANNNNNNNGGNRHNTNTNIRKNVSFHSKEYGVVIELSFCRRDGKKKNAGVVLSSVVHRLPHKRVLMASTPELRKILSPYTLMTKMMKIKTILNQEKQDIQIGMYDGTFVMFKTLPLIHHHNNDDTQESSLQFHQAVRNFVECAARATKDFRTYSKGRQLSSSRIQGKPLSPGPQAA
eukprot:CAMPEP_0116578312 /NCGR_PEP_ID=MMETSP0397-20121206/21641_1 /TAXON_ID=216820 /ORGANISM="Cyclophora tenuis, Strain ECT3854" /LENGTH=179 /DNA_ID=CAMNT_0004107697 /DNA_START=97 /DNA_END=636 /DNA_ORIENTATION=+